jgi:adenine-specific DNA-methyltransferase
MIDYVFEHTLNFLANMPKAERKKKGQFFTSKETAAFMANMFDLTALKGTVTILDPGAGTGILSAALIDRIENDAAKKIKKIILTCYENDPDVLPELNENLAYIKSNCKIDFDYCVNTDDYLLSQTDNFDNTLFSSADSPKYDLIIGNPPYLRVMRDNPAALSMPEVVHGAPNLYFLFASMSLFNLKEQCEMVYIIPRSWTSGLYFTAFRKYFLNHGKLEQIHIFVSRDKVFKQEQVLQETIIVKLEKTERAKNTVLITSSTSSNDFDNITSLTVPYSTVVVGPDYYVYLPTTKQEVEVIQKINKYNKCLPDIGLRMKTGIVVDFRQYDDLRREPGQGIIPLFYSQHIKNGRVNHNPSGKDFDWIIDTKPGLIQKNKNYVFCKRFTAKEERRRLQCGIYFAADFPEYDFIGTQNKINFVDEIDGSDMPLPIAYGIYALLNSTLFDTYYRILNGSTQVNSTEINNIPVPSIGQIEQIGRALLDSDSLSTDVCDELLERFAYE